MSLKEIIIYHKYMKKNIFIIGNSYADNLLNIFSNNKKLVDDYYFYTALADNLGANYQIECLNDFFKENKLICDKNLFSFLQTQYKKSNYIVFAERFDEGKTFLSDDFDKIVGFLKNDKKKFIVFLDDISGADMLDIYIHRRGRLPNLYELEELENEFFEKVVNWKKNKLKKVKDKLSKNNIKFLTRSELFCDYFVKKCHLIKDDNKLYRDYGHITNNGANYFSKEINSIINKLIND